MALKVDCQQVTAFNRLLSNYLMSKDDCMRLLMAMSFSPETLWLRDYYTSRINLEIRSKENQEGVVRIKVGDNNISHLGLASE